MSLPTLAEIYDRARIMAGRTPEDDALARLKRSRLHKNQFNVGPGQGAPVEVGADGDIRKAVMPFPYKDVSPGFVALIDKLREYATNDDLNARLADAAVKFLSEGLCEWARQEREYAQ